MGKIAKIILSNDEFKKVLHGIFVCSVIVTTIFTASPSQSKYALNTASYDIMLNSANSFEGDFIPMTEVPPTYNDYTLPPNSGPVTTTTGATVKITDPVSGETYYVVIKNNITIWRDAEGILRSNNQNSFLKINSRRLDWYSDVSGPNYSSWNNFYNTNQWAQGDVLIWHFGNPDQTRTFVWSFKTSLNDQPPNGKWVEID